MANKNQRNNVLDFRRRFRDSEQKAIGSEKNSDGIETKLKNEIDGTQSRSSSPANIGHFVKQYSEDSSKSELYGVRNPEDIAGDFLDENGKPIYKASTVMQIRYREKSIFHTEGGLSLAELITYAKSGKPSNRKKGFKEAFLNSVRRKYGGSDKPQDVQVIEYLEQKVSPTNVVDYGQYKRHSTKFPEIDKIAGFLSVEELADMAKFNLDELVKYAAYMGVKMNTKFDNGPIKNIELKGMILAFAQSKKYEGLADQLYKRFYCTE